LSDKENGDLGTFNQVIALCCCIFPNTIL